jgi:ribosomal protection tetracycline resistance protein
VLHRTLNLGILAHVDAGKTTLTERLLYDAGVIDEIGSVDAGTTQTDSMALERQRGITIRSAVVSFAIGAVTVNLIDTPGHPDFIAEVERVLSVLDGAVLVISAVEGVQPQTRVLMRALRRLEIPTLLFVNKIDRRGAAGDPVLRAASRRLSPAVVPMGRPHALGTKDASFALSGEARLAEALAEHDDEILAGYLADEAIAYPRLRATLAAQTKRAVLHPVFFGSAATGAGVPELTAGIAELLPSAAGDADGPVSGSVFKIERGAGGEKIAYVRLFSGTVRLRDRLRFGGGRDGKVTALGVVGTGERTRVRAGQIGMLRGLDTVRVGDRIGASDAEPEPHQFPPPTLESAVAATSTAGRARLPGALAQLAEQDPLINVRQDGRTGELSVSLYGEVQQEVIGSTLAAEYGIAVTFREATTIHVERPAGTGEAAEVLNTPDNPFLATIGLRVEPAPAGTGFEFRLAVEARAVPMYVYRTVDNFAAMMAGYVRGALGEGRFGWQVTDCTVTMFRCGYSSPDGPPSTRGPLSGVADFRKLTPLVLATALARAGTVVCEPMTRLAIEIPPDAAGTIVTAVTRLGGAVGTVTPRGDLALIETELPASQAQRLQRQLPNLSAGEGVAEASFAGYRPVTGTPPTRRRTTADPLKRS